MENDKQFLELIQNELKNEAKGLSANESSRLAALSTLRAKNSKKKTLVLPLIFSYKIPVWMAAAAVVLMFFLFPTLFKSNIEEHGNTQQVAVQDTVYVDRIVSDTVKVIEQSEPIIQTVYIKEYTSNVTSVPPKHMIDDNKLKVLTIRRLESEMAMRSDYESIDFTVQSSGRSLSNDPLGKSVLQIAK